MRLVRAEVREAQINDTGYLEAIGDAALRAATVESYRAQIASDRAHVRTRQDAPYSGIQIARG